MAEHPQTFDIMSSTSSLSSLSSLTCRNRRFSLKRDFEATDISPQQGEDKAGESLDAFEKNYGTEFVAKRRRQNGADLILFDQPFACAFSVCRFRATCSYHHGEAIPCNCDNFHCPRGHPHRRRPEACDHGGPHQCRWNQMGECSFHHGVATPCECDNINCQMAHVRRVKKNRELRKYTKEKEENDEERQEQQQQQQQDQPKQEKKKYKGNKPKGAKSKGQNHYQKWRDTQKTRETNAEKRRRYLELYPNGPPNNNGKTNLSPSLPLAFDSLIRQLSQNKKMYDAEMAELNIS